MDPSYVDDVRKFQSAPLIEMVNAPRAGYLVAIDAREVGETSVELGAGRSRKTDPIDHSVGIVIHHKVGDRVEKEGPLFTVHANSPEKLAQAKERLLSAHQWSEVPCQPLPLFYGVIGE